MEDVDDEHHAQEAAKEFAPASQDVAFGLGYVVCVVHADDERHDEREEDEGEEVDDSIKIHDGLFPCALCCFGRLA